SVGGGDPAPERVATLRVAVFLCQESAANFFKNDSPRPNRLALTALLPLRCKTLRRGAYRCGVTSTSRPGAKSPGEAGEVRWDAADAPARRTCDRQCVPAGAGTKVRQRLS